jgi:hypothetical protein
LYPNREVGLVSENKGWSCIRIERLVLYQNREVGPVSEYRGWSCIRIECWSCIRIERFVLYQNREVGLDLSILIQDQPLYSDTGLTLYSDTRPTSLF